MRAHQLNRSAGAARRGTAAVELAALLPFLLLLALIATDWARLLYYTVTLEEVARNGALYAIDPGTQAQSPYYDATKTAAENLTAAAVAGCPDLSPVPNVDQTTGTDADGNPTVVVTASTTFTTIATVPGSPASQTITRRVQMRAVPTLN